MQKLMLVMITFAMLSSWASCAIEPDMSGLYRLLTKEEMDAEENKERVQFKLVEFDMAVNEYYFAVRKKSQDGKNVVLELGIKTNKNNNFTVVIQKGYPDSMSRMKKQNQNNEMYVQKGDFVKYFPRDQIQFMVFGRVNCELADENAEFDFENMDPLSLVNGKEEGIKVLDHTEFKIEMGVFSNEPKRNIGELQAGIFNNRDVMVHMGYLKDLSAISSEKKEFSYLINTETFEDIITNPDFSDKKNEVLQHILEDVAKVCIVNVSSGATYKSSQENDFRAAVSVAVQALHPLLVEYTNDPSIFDFSPSREKFLEYFNGYMNGTVNIFYKPVEQWDTKMGPMMPLPNYKLDGGPDDVKDVKDVDPTELDLSATNLEGRVIGNFVMGKATVNKLPLSTIDFSQFIETVKGFTEFNDFDKERERMAKHYVDIMKQFLSPDALQIHYYLHQIDGADELFKKYTMASLAIPDFRYGIPFKNAAHRDFYNAMLFRNMDFRTEFSNFMQVLKGNKRRLLIV